MAAKKKTTKQARAPRQVWATMTEGSKMVDDVVFATRKEAVDAVKTYEALGYPSVVVGPYMLAERVAQR